VIQEVVEKNSECFDALGMNGKKAKDFKMSPFVLSFVEALPEDSSAPC
jgi:hypothetical protein